MYIDIDCFPHLFSPLGRTRILLQIIIMQNVITN